MKKLKFAETPFHRLNERQLLIMAIRMYDAIVAAKSVLKMSELRDPSSSFWTQGTGGRALEMCEQIVKPLEKKYGSEAIWRMFYRPFNDLLWDNTNKDLTTNWAICSKCGMMIGASLGKDGRRNNNDKIGKKCSEATPFGKKRCDGIMRKLKWSDAKMRNT